MLLNKGADVNLANKVSDTAHLVIDSLSAHKVSTDQLCISDTGGSTCVVCSPNTGRDSSSWNIARSDYSGCPSDAHPCSSARRARSHRAGCPPHSVSPTSTRAFRSAGFSRSDPRLRRHGPAEWF